MTGFLPGYLDSKVRSLLQNVTTLKNQTVSTCYVLTFNKGSMSQVFYMDLFSIALLYEHVSRGKSLAQRCHKDGP